MQRKKLKDNTNIFYKITPKRVAFLGILVACALLTFMLESLLPPLFVPGAKIGLANIFTLLALILLSPAEALLLVVVRTTLGCLILGNPFAIVYSLTAGLGSLVASILLVKLLPKISIMAISIVGAVIHNLIQNIIFCLINQTYNLFALMPYLALIGVLAGAVVGVCVYMLIHKIPYSFFARYLS